MAVSDLKRNLDAQLERAFDAVAKRAGNTLVFNGRKAACVATPISREQIHEIVGWIPKRWADVETTRTAFEKLGCDNEDYVALDGTVLRIRRRTDDLGDPFVHLVLHSTPDQGGAAAVEDSGTVALTIGQQQVVLVFQNVNPNKPHAFTTLNIENAIDSPPILDLEATPGQIVGNGRRLELNGAPDTANYVLHWKAVQQ